MIMAFAVSDEKNNLENYQVLNTGFAWDRNSFSHADRVNTVACLIDKVRESFQRWMQRLQDH